MHLHASDALIVSPEEHHDVITFGSTMEPMPRRQSRLAVLRSMTSTVRDSVMAVFLVVAAAMALSTVESLIEHAPSAPLFSQEQSASPWFNQLLGIQTAYAAPLKGYEALPISVPSKLTLQPGQTKTITITFQNLGPNIWKNSGSNFVSLYTYTPKYRTSVFQSTSWHAADQPAVLNESSVAVGGTGTLTLTLTAPTNVGTYSEGFNLAAEDVAWIPGGAFTIAITVQNAPTGKQVVPTATTKTTTPATTTTTAAPLTGSVVNAAPSIIAKGGISVIYSAVIQNTGSTAWGDRTLRPANVQLATTTLLADAVYHKSWKASNVVLEETTPVQPGGQDNLTFAFSTPKHKGSYDIVFNLTVDGTTVDGASIDIPVTVTQDAPDAASSPLTSTPSSGPAASSPDQNAITSNIVMTEPTNVRVGVLIVDEETDNKVVISCATGMTIQNTTGNVLATIPANDPVTAYYKTSNSMYYYLYDAVKKKFASPIRFVPDTLNAVMTVTNFDRTKTRGSAYPDNTFRNILELRYNTPNDRTWLINELSFETYLDGLGETSNSSPMEYQKALITAARSYAYYLYQRSTKHASEGFTVDAYADQVYKGYGAEQRDPNVVEAVNETRGVIVTYQGQAAITPYYSSSDGRTRSWTEVWGGNIPYCVSVSVPWDKEHNRKLFGHGVGLSATASIDMANDGYTFQGILHYFYTGVDLQKWWN